MELFNPPLNDPLPLPQVGSWPKSVHLFDETSVYAIQAALAAQRPLLVRGEPGIGKSQLARAAAHFMKRAFVSVVVHARTESQDLLYQFDSVGRLAEAQLMSVLGQTNPEEARKRMKPEHFLSPGPLWWVFDWEGAQQQFDGCKSGSLKPEAPAGWEPKDGVVLLIDEIDKADADLPNGLLETLGNGAFKIPQSNQTVGHPQKQTAIPLVIITTNEERELPAAFLRRCLVLNLKLPAKRSLQIEALTKTGNVHFKGQCSPKLQKEVAELLHKDRKSAYLQGSAIPGQAEYLDILRALCSMTEGLGESEREKKQQELLDKISLFALKKQPSEFESEMEEEG